MKMRKIIAVLLTTALILTGCSTREVLTVKDEHAQTPGLEWLATLNYGNSYIRHPDNTTETFYLGVNNLDPIIPDNSSPSRVVWFKDDFNSIPTMYAGDSLIYVTQNEFAERFYFERFEDVGYSFGLIGLSISPTGRFKVSTNLDYIFTYPSGDTDCLLNHAGPNVILDSIGGTQIRADKYDANNNLIEPGNMSLSHCGSIICSGDTNIDTAQGLAPNRSYDVLLYQGTEGYHYTWTSNIRILSSMEMFSTTTFNFESESIINIEFPDYCNSGYYLINGIGLFRYLKDCTYDQREAYQDELVDMNIPNEYPIEEEYYYGIPKGDPIVDETVRVTKDNFSALPPQVNTTNSSSDTKTKAENSAEEEPASTNNSSTYSVQYDIDPGKLNATVFMDEGDNSGVTALVKAPDGATYTLTKTNNTIMGCTFYVNEPGRYEIVVDGLNGRTCTCSMSYYDD